MLQKLAATGKDTIAGAISGTGITLENLSAITLRFFPDEDCDAVMKLKLKGEGGMREKFAALLANKPDLFVPQPVAGGDGDAAMSDENDDDLFDEDEDDEDDLFGDDDDEEQTLSSDEDMGEAAEIDDDDDDDEDQGRVMEEDAVLPARCDREVWPVLP